jgi:predicted DNA-binding transcriptional regulator YafY
MRNAVALETKFKRPARFDLAKHWRRCTAELEARRGKYSAVLDVTGNAANLLAAWVATKLIGPAARSTAAENGWVRMRAEFEHLNQARFVVLGFGASVRVIEPAELREAVESELRAMAALRLS